MSSRPSADRFGNPFSTRHVRPGAIAFRFVPGDSAAACAQRLAAAGWQGQIVGPHGSGKSTLLASLLPELESLGRHPCLITLHDGQRRLPAVTTQQPELARPAVIVVDGYEQLSRWSRWRLAWQCRRRGWGLLVTTHRPVRLPVIATTRTSPELAAELVASLLPAGGVIGGGEVVARFEARGGNLRDVLFDCYDLYEARRSSAAPPAAQ